MGRPVKVQIFSIAPYKKNVGLPTFFLYSLKKRDKKDVKMNNEYEKVMSVIADLSKDYIVWAKADLARLDGVFRIAYAKPIEGRDAVIRGDLFRIAHDMKGQGATFSYDLITTVGNFLCRYIERQEFFDEEQMQTIRLLISMLHDILDKNLINDGGAEGIDILKQLDGIR